MEFPRKMLNNNDSPNKTRFHGLRQDDEAIFDYF